MRKAKTSYLCWATILNYISKMIHSLLIFRHSHIFLLITTIPLHSARKVNYTKTNSLHKRRGQKNSQQHKAVSCRKKWLVYTRSLIDAKGIWQRRAYVVSDLKKYREAGRINQKFKILEIRRAGGGIIGRYKVLTWRRPQNKTSFFYLKFSYWSYASNVPLTRQRLKHVTYIERKIYRK